MAPVSLDLIKAELTPSKKLRDTNKGSNEIYVVNHFDSPNIMLEIGRLREEAVFLMRKVKYYFKRGRIAVSGDFLVEQSN